MTRVDWAGRLLRTTLALVPLIWGGHPAHAADTSAGKTGASSTAREAGAKTDSTAAANNTATRTVIPTPTRRPIAFEENRGQADPNVKFIARTATYTLFLTPKEAILCPRTASNAMVRMHLGGGAKHPKIAGVDGLPGKVYYANPEAKGRLTPAGTFRRVHYPNVYPSIDLTYYGNDEALEFDFTLAPRADPNQIRLSFDGARSVTVGNEGELRLETSADDLVLKAPIVYQERDGVRRHITGRYVVSDRRKGEVRFALGAYDRSLPLVIDPTIVYATYSGTAGSESISAIQVNKGGQMYLFGSTTALPSLGSPAVRLETATTDPIYTPLYCFVSKLSSDAQDVVFQVYFQGFRECQAFAVGPSGHVHLAMRAPYAFGGFAQLRTLSGDDDSGNAGAMMLSGLNFDQVTAIPGRPYVVRDMKADSSGNVYVLYQQLGQADAALQSRLAKVNAIGELIHGTTGIDVPFDIGLYELGAGSGDVAVAMALDEFGQVFVIGNTHGEFHTTPNAFQTQSSAALSTGDVFLAQVDTAQFPWQIPYATLAGGDSHDAGLGIARDPLGFIYLTGRTSSFNFPMASSAFQGSPNLSQGEGDGFILKLDLNQSGEDQLVAGTFLGLPQFGPDFGWRDAANPLVVLPGGELAITGITTGTLLVNELFQGGLVRAANPFIAIFSAEADALVMGTRLDNIDEATHSLIQGNGAQALISVIETTEPGRGTPGVDQPTLVGGVDLLVSKFDLADVLANAPPTLDLGPDRTLITETTVFDFDLATAYSVGDPDGVINTFTWRIDGGAPLVFAAPFSATFPLPLGRHVLTLAVTDDQGATVDDTLVVEVERGLSNGDPLVDAGPDTSRVATSPTGATVVLFGRVSDPDNDILTITWTGNFPTIQFEVRPPYFSGNAAVYARLPIGVTEATLTVNDGHGHVTSDTTIFTLAGTNTAAGAAIDVTVQDDRVTEYNGFTPGRLELTFDTVTAPGLTWMRTRTDQLPPPPAGKQLGSAPYYHDVTSTAAGTGNVRACIDTTGMSFTAAQAARLHRLNGTAWDDIAVTSTPAEAAAHYVCGATSFFTTATFALFTAADESMRVTTILDDLTFSDGVAVDPARQYLYVAQLSEVRRIDLQTQANIRIAGNGSTDLSEIRYNVDALDTAFFASGSMAVDQAGNIYVPDLNGCGLVRLEPRSNFTSYFLTRVAGKGPDPVTLACGYGGDSGAAVDADVTVAGGITFDRTGNMFFVQNGYARGNVLRRITPGADGVVGGAADEIITTIAGEGTTWPPNGNPHEVYFGGSLGSLTFSPQGDLYLGLSSQIGRLTAAPDAQVIDGRPGEVITSVSGGGILLNPLFQGDGGPAMNAEWNNARSIALQPNGDLIVADSGLNRLRRITAGADGIVNGGADEMVSTFAGFSENFPDIPFNGDGYALSTSFSSPRVVLNDPRGRLVVADVGHNRLRRIGLGAATGSGADLGVTLTASPNPIDAGSTVTYTATVTNGGPSTATGIAVSMPVPGGYAAWAQSPAGFCIVPILHFAGTITCDGGSLLSGESIQITITLTPPVRGTLASTATASTATSDPVPDNNSRTVVVEALDRIAPTAVISAPSPVAVGTSLTASAVGSTDAGGGQIASYQWTLIERGVTIETTVPAVTFAVTPAEPLSVGPYTIQLVVFDDSGNASVSATATVLVIAPVSLNASNDSYTVTRDSTLVSGHRLVTQFPSGPFDTAPLRTLVNVNGTLFFAEYCHLRKSDGTTAGTVLVKDICATNLTNVDGTLFFAGRDASGTRLWKSDGTEAGTVMVQSSAQGLVGLNPRELTNVDGQLFFIVDIIAEGEVAGSELWRSDGTDSGTTMVKAFPGRGGAFFPRNVSGTLYFRVLPDGLWRSDGTTVGTVRIKNIRVDGGVPNLAFPHFSPWFPDWPVSVNGKYAFFGQDPDSQDDEIWASDPVDGAVRLLEMNAETGHERVLLDLAAAGDRLYFGVIDVTIRPEDWAACLANAGEQFCLLQPPYSGTREIWTSDGTPAATSLLKVFGPFSPQAISGSPFFFTVGGNSVFFLQGSGLWKTDGTEAGTALVKTAQVQPASDFAGTSHRMTDVNGTLFFRALHLGLTGLWKSDGTEAGTVPVQSGAPGYASFDFTNVNGAFFFTIPYEGARRRELWVAGAAANVLANDILQTPQSVTATIVQPVSHGTLAFNPDGTFIYRPNPGFSGDDTFIYTVTDGTATSSPATVTIHVTTLPATISITNAEAVEGNSGTTNLVFTITRSGLDLSGSASVDFATANGSAAAGSDYVHQSGAVTFAPDETSKQVSVPAIGDTSDEGNEVFFLNLGNAVGAAILRTRAYGTIVNDDVEADLQVAVTAPSLVGAGGTIQYTVVITNNGPSPATLVGMSLPVSAAQLLGVSATSPAGFCLVPVLFLVPAGTVFCPAGTLAPHASITVTVDATLRANPLSNTVVATFSVGGHESDPVPDNNTHTVETEVEPSVDLRLVPLAPALTGTVTVGVPASFRMTVTNVGGGAAQVARLNFHPPAGLQFVSASMPGAVCDFIGFLVCDIDNFAPGASVEAVVVVTPLASGPVTATFTVSSPHIDLNLANNGITFDINRAPFANAGADQNIAINPTTGQGEFVVTSVGSSDPDGDPLVLTWSRNGELLGNFMATWQILPVGNYVYTLTATDGRGGVATDTVEVTVHGTGLAAPTNVSAQATAPGSVTISWNPVPGASGYRILRSPDPVTFQIPHIDPPLHAVVGSPFTFDVTGTSTVDSGLPTLVRQDHAVQATNGSIVSLPAPAQGGDVLVTAAPDAEIFGVADFHNHQFANLGFGRSLIWGHAFSPAGILDALPSCEAIHGSGGLLDLLGNIRTNPPGSFPVPVPITVPSMTFTPPNQAPMTTPSFLLLTSGHFTGGIAASNGISFDGWPRWNSITHQQVYYEWLRRAFDGGLRLMVMHALNNQLLCQISGTMNQTLGNFSCNDMDNIDDQLNMAKSLEAFIDGQSGGTGKGWYRIAYSATDARHIINSGKMAVILGIEVDDLFGCSLPSACTEQFVRDRLNHYYDMGVRHLFPVHAFDNAFGGTALFDPLFDLGNRLVEGQFVVRRECSPEGYGYKAQPNQLAAQLQLPDPGTTAFVADCNARPLQPLGDVLIRKMMAKGMIIDIDHMSARTAELVMQRAEQYGYAGIITGHSGSTSVLQGTPKSEGAKTPAQLARVRAVGGVSGIFAGQGDRVRPGNANGVVAHPGSTIANDCGNSSKTFAQVYLATVDALGGAGTAAVGFGTDFNGLASMPGPRFGPESCSGDTEQSPQANRVTYPLTIASRPGVYAGRLAQTASPNRVAKDNPFDPFQNAHQKAWDINEDGLAHVGMLPDFIQELRNVGVTDAQLQPLFRSAEGYIRMWERAEATAPVVTPPASITIAGTESAGARGNASADLHTFLLGGSAIDVGPVTRLALQVGGLVVDDQALFPLGTTEVIFRFSDGAGHIGSAIATVTVVQGSGTLVVDDGVAVNLLADGSSLIGTLTFADVQQEGFVTATMLTRYPALPIEFVALTPVYDIVTTALHGGIVDVCLNGSGFQPDDRLLHHEGGAWTDVTRGVTALTICGQVASLSPFVAVRPVNRPPTADAGSYGPLEATSPAGASVTLVGTGSDPDTGNTLTFVWQKGASTIGHIATLTIVLPLGTHDLTLTVSDNHGLSATASTRVIVRDTTPPNLVAPPSQSATTTNASGVAVNYPPAAATDTASGVQSVQCAPASGSVFPVGATTVACTVRDVAGNTATATFTVTVQLSSPQTLDGRMFGIGFIAAGSQHHHVLFHVMQRDGVDDGRLEYWFNDSRFCAKDDDFSIADGSMDSHYGHDHAAPKWFHATAITEVVFTDDPAFRPGWALGGEPKGDTVRVKGTGKWNGQAGYTFEAVTSDRGEPGRNRDRFSIVIRNASGQTVASVNDTLDAGNLQAANVFR